MQKIILDMETGDPDDFLTLLWLLDHPLLDLIAVTITPGTPEQIGLVRRALGWFQRDIPVGSWKLEDRPRSCVSSWHTDTWGAIDPSTDAEDGPSLLCRLCGPEVTMITGAPLKNLSGALALAEASDREDGYPAPQSLQAANRKDRTTTKPPRFFLGRLVAQGGFAGEGVVPPEEQLPKFRGKATCPSYNLNGDPKGALRVLATTQIGIRRFVSKNVCHGVVYDQELHEALGRVKGRRKGLTMIHDAMDRYLRKHPGGKIFHDPLAACCALDEGIGRWAEVEIVRERGEWGSRLAPGSRTWIIVGYDRARFLRVLLGDA